MNSDTIVVREQLGATYESALVPVDAGDAAFLKDRATGRIFPVQTAPAMPFDRTGTDAISLVLVDLQPGEELALAPTDERPSDGPAIRIESAGPQTVVANGSLAVRLPADGGLEQPFPGPIESMRCVDGSWFGACHLTDAPYRGAVHTEMESVGPCCVQWRTTYRWGGDGGVSYRMRWAAGSDTLLVDEQIFETCDAAVEWFPFGRTPARAFVWGGGERNCPMVPLEYERLDGARRETGRRKLNYISHVSYWNQWNLSWLGFSAGDDRFVGIFSACGGLWHRRGFVRPEVYEDDERGGLVRFPMKQGRRLYGLVISTRAESGLEATEGKCLLNRRKAQLSDLALAKVRTWELDPPLDEKRPHLVRQEDLDTFRDRIAVDGELAAAIGRFVEESDEAHSGRLAGALWKNDREMMRACIPRMVTHAEERMLRQVARGGYERLIIFDGRLAKRLAYDLDVLWALDVIDEESYRRVRKAFLALAYMFADPDYCTYADFWPHTEPQEGIALALKDDMGDCPVPPNFASEFFTTTGVMAELFEKHPMRDEWRRFAIEQSEKFLETFYEPDGTYHESINYQTHEFNERLCLFYPLWFKGVRDFFSDERVKGTFRFSVQAQMPPLSDSIGKLEGPAPASRPGVGDTLYAAWRPPRSVLPAGGNSGGHGLEQEHRGGMALGAHVYRRADPQLAGQLMYAWRRAGRIIPLHTHPVLTVVTVDPTIESIAPPVESCHRHGLGIISKAEKPDGAPVWCLFRAGSATHHMDFDQANIHLAAWDSVLLGDHGYHTQGERGESLPAAATWLHNTIVYSDDRNMSSGYTGLERAPAAVLVHLGAGFDWCVHRIVNTNFRALDRLKYTQMLPAPATRHVRHYLFVKPDYFLIWDVFERAHSPSVFWLHPRQRVVEEGRGAYRSGEPGGPHVLIRFLLPEDPEVIENQPGGPLWNFAVRNATAGPYLTLLVPQKEAGRVDASVDADGRMVRVQGSACHDVISLPEPGSTTCLPRIERH